MVCSATETLFLRGVHDHDASAGRRREVDVVDARPCPADDAQPARRLEDLLRHLGGAAHGDGIVAADDLAQRGGIEATFTSTCADEPDRESPWPRGEIVGDRMRITELSVLLAAAPSRPARASPLPGSMRHQVGESALDGADDDEHVEVVEVAEWAMRKIFPLASSCPPTSLIRIG